jgi:recombination protein RecT
MNPRLGECQPASVFACVIQASQLGLRPGLLGECYLIPYKNRDGIYICTLQLGYQGLLELVRRSGLVEAISAHLVRDRDLFDVQWGTTPGIVHRPYLDGDPGNVRLVYSVARLKGGGTHAELMTVDDIERIRNRSQNVISAKRFNKDTPWDTDWDEMARKTVLRRICKYLPKSSELASALSIDDSATRGAQQITLPEALSNSYVPPPFIGIDPETGETDPPPPPPPAAEPPAPRRRRAAAAAPEPEPAPPPETEDAPPAPPAPPANEQDTDEGPARRSYARLADAIVKAANAEAAAVVLDQARGVLDAEDLDDLAAVYQREWKEPE